MNLGNNHSNQIPCSALLSPSPHAALWVISFTLMVSITTNIANYWKSISVLNSLFPGQHWNPGPLFYTLHQTNIDPLPEFAFSEDGITKTHGYHLHFSSVSWQFVFCEYLKNDILSPLYLWCPSISLLYHCSNLQMVLCFLICLFKIHFLCSFQVSLYHSFSWNLSMTPITSEAKDLAWHKKPSMT